GARRLSLLVAAVVVVASASAALALVTTRRHHGGSGSGSSCALAIRFNGVDYLGATMKQRLRLGRALGQATVPPCPAFTTPRPRPVGRDSDSLTPARRATAATGVGSRTSRPAITFVRPASPVSSGERPRPPSSLGRSLPEPSSPTRTPPPARSSGAGRGVAPR